MPTFAGDLPGEIARALMLVMQAGWGSVFINIEDGRIVEVGITTVLKTPQENGQERDLVEVLGSTTKGKDDG